ncbi:MAG: SirB2 family protein [Pseudomonadales bacterium]|nr:SirB2 family protein [Pseudomonadales bacterium]MCP5185702.1 SirB2 family protein [Pseudomonadales bacterium]
MLALRNIHMALAILSVVGFILRAAWAFMGSPVLKSKPVRILPHVNDTLLLVLGVVLAYGLGWPVTSGWLAAKLVALLAYIGFGVVTLRATTNPMRLVGVVGALSCVGYIFMVAFTKNPLPFA